MNATARVTIETGSDQPPEPVKRRQYTIAEKRRIVEESFRPGISVARVARMNGVNANQVFSWRRLYQRGRLGGSVPASPTPNLLPVSITEPETNATPASPPPGSIQLQSSRGRLRIEGAVDSEALRVIVQFLLA